MRKERGVTGKLGLLLFILALIAGCSSKPVCNLFFALPAILSVSKSVFEVGVEPSGGFLGQGTG